MLRRARSGLRARRCSQPRPRRSPPPRPQPIAAARGPGAPAPRRWAAGPGGGARLGFARRPPPRRDLQRWGARSVRSPGRTGWDLRCCHRPPTLCLGDVGWSPEDRGHGKCLGRAAGLDCSCQVLLCFLTYKGMSLPRPAEPPGPVVLGVAGGEEAFENARGKAEEV